MKWIKKFKSPGYNYHFNSKDGLFLRWGKDVKDDPDYSPFGPGILDIEISSVCSNGCKFCYKSNTAKGKNMSLDKYKKIFSKFPDHVTQIAFGIGDIDSNKDLWKIMEYTRENKVVPNVTINGSRMTPEYYDKLANVCGAVAVSLYDHDVCYDAVKELTDRGMDQINIHCLLSNETYDKCMKVLKDKLEDGRLEKLNAVVFLWLKPKGKRNTLTQLKDMDKFKKLIDFAFENEIGIGFDSCSSGNFLEAIKDKENYETISNYVEPCESCCFSYYLNVDGIGFPCSFSEEVDDYEGIDIENCDNFLGDVWFGKESRRFRKDLLETKCNGSCRSCPLYDLHIGGKDED